MAIKSISKHISVIILLTAFLCLNSYSVKAQYLYELGFGGGMSGYTGEVSNNPFSSPGYTFGAFYRWNLSSRFALRAGLDYANVRGNTGNVPASYPDFEGISGFDFQTRVFSSQVLFEVNYFPYPFQKMIMNSSNITPFSFIGIGMENYGSVPCVSLPLGVGVRWKFSDQWGMQFQFKAVKMFADDLDGSQLDNTLGLGDAAIHRQDWMYGTTIMLTYSFGEDIWDCNCPKEKKRKSR